jgi:hypothetical protein
MSKEDDRSVEMSSPATPTESEIGGEQLSSASLNANEARAIGVSGEESDGSPELARDIEQEQVEKGVTEAEPEPKVMGPQPSERREDLRASASEAGLFKELLEPFRHFLNDYIAGDKYSAERGQQFVHSTIHYHLNTAAPPPPKNDPGLEITVDFEALLATFVPPGDCEDALQLLRQHGALIISGAPGNGRRTLAYYLLQRLEAIQEIPFRQLGSASSLLDLDDETFAQVETHRAYLLCPDAYAWGDGLNQEKLERLVERVRQKHSFLIVIWPEGLAVPFGVIWHIRLTSRNLPPPTDVFLKHLEYLLKCEQISVQPEELDALQSNDDVRQVLSEAHNLKRSVRLATFVTDLMQAGSSVEDVVRECRRQRTQWLYRDALEMVTIVPSQAHLCLLMAAAAMSDIHVDFFKGLADKLQEALDANFSEQDHECWQQFWAGPRSRWLEAAHAQVTPMMEWVLGRRARVDVIKITPETMSIPLVDAFWDEYPQHRDSFRDWLEKCGRHPNFRVRLAAARALGILSLRDPFSIERLVIMPWILTEDIAVQESAAMSLAMASGQSPSTARAVLERLAKWVEDDAARPRLLFASAIIYAWLGMDTPQEFITGMDRLVKSRDAWVLRVHGRTGILTDTGTARLSAIRFAFQRFLQLGSFEPINYVALLRKILDWVQSSSHVQRRIAREVFVDMMLVDEALEISSWKEREDDSVSAWPILLGIMQRSDETPLLAARLFEQAAAVRGTWWVSIGGVKRMIIFAGQHPEARSSLKDFIYNILVNGKQPEIGKELKRRLVHWAKTTRTATHPAPYSRQLVVWLHDSNLLDP